MKRFWLQTAIFTLVGSLVVSIVGCLIFGEQEPSWGKNLLSLVPEAGGACLLAVILMRRRILDPQAKIGGTVFWLFELIAALFGSAMAIFLAVVSSGEPGGALSLLALPYTIIVANFFFFIFVPIAYAFIWLVRRSPNHAAVVHHA